MDCCCGAVGIGVCGVALGGGAGSRTALCDPDANRRTRMTTPALELSDVRKRFGQTEIIRGVTLSIGKGERHALIGPNGAGKSTTFNLISGRFAPTSGSVKLNGQSIAGLRPFEINRMGLSRSFQITNIFHRL